jgi:hypothetical protein
MHAALLNSFTLLEQHAFEFGSYNKTKVLYVFELTVFTAVDVVHDIIESNECVIDIFIS